MTNYSMPTPNEAADVRWMTQRCELSDRCRQELLNEGNGRRLEVGLTTDLRWFWLENCRFVRRDGLLPGVAAKVVSEEFKGTGWIVKGLVLAHSLWHEWERTIEIFAEVDSLDRANLLLFLTTDQAAVYAGRMERLRQAPVPRQKWWQGFDNFGRRPTF